MTPETMDTVAMMVSDPSAPTAVRMVVVLTALAVLPGLVMLMTPFVRFVIVLSMARQALGLQQSPPNQVLVALALVLTAAVMQPTIAIVDQTAIQPYLAGEVDTTTALTNGLAPMRGFMLEHVRRDDLWSAIRIARIARPATVEDLPSSVIVTGYVLSELRSAFVIGVKVYVPFVVLDLVVASVLLGTGMMMLPPVVVSLPVKLLVFVLMDGWTLLLTGLARSVQ